MRMNIRSFLTFLQILDQLHVALTDRVNAYTIFHQRFSFLLTLDKVDDLQPKCQTLCDAYPDDFRKEKSCTLKCYNTRTSSTSCALCTQRRKMRVQLRGNSDYYLSRALQMISIMWMCATVSTCVSWSPTAEVSGHFQF